MEERHRGHLWLDAILELEFSNHTQNPKVMDCLKTMEMKTYQLLGWDLQKRTLNRTLYQSEVLIKDELKKRKLL